MVLDVNEKIGYAAMVVFAIIFIIMAIEALTGRWIPGESELAGFQKT